MKVKDVVVARFKNLCNLQNIKLNELATISGVTPSTVYSLMDEKKTRRVYNYYQKALRRVRDIAW